MSKKKTDLEKGNSDFINNDNYTIISPILQILNSKSIYLPSR